MPNAPFPVPDPTEPFWHRELDRLDEYRSSDTVPETVDIAIIGSGYAGVSTAYHLLQSQNEQAHAPSIAILEARGACSGATGRNGGHCKPDPFTRASIVLESHGKEAAEEVTSFESRHLREIAQLVKQEQIDCDFVLTRATDVCLYSQGSRNIEEKLRKLTDAGVTGLDDVFHCSGKTAEGISGIKQATSATTYSAGHLWPYKMILHLLSKLIDRGVQLYTYTPVESVSADRTPDGYWNVSTSRGNIRAKTIVYASNAYTAGILPELRDKIVPVRGICSHIVSPKPTAPLLSNSYILRFNDWEYDYLIPRSDGSIVVGGARRDFHMDLDSWFGSYDDSKMIESAEHYFDSYMQRHFRGWEDSDAYTESIWTGIMGYTADGFPLVGEVPAKPNAYICAGFSGHGMPQAFLSARAIAEMIVNGKQIHEVDLPRVYRASKERIESKDQHVSLAAWDAIPQEYKQTMANGGA